MEIPLEGSVVSIFDCVECNAMTSRLDPRLGQVDFTEDRFSVPIIKSG